MNINKYFIKIANLIIDNNTEYIYRKIMLSIIDIIESNELLYVIDYQDEFNYAIDYWRYYQGTKQGLLDCRIKIHEFFLSNKWSSLDKKNRKNTELNYIYRLVLSPFEEENLDRNCDNLYWFVNTISSYGISQHQSIKYFEKYFDEIYITKNS